MPQKIKGDVQSYWDIKCKKYKKVYDPQKIVVIWTKEELLKLLKKDI